MDKIGLIVTVNKFKHHFETNQTTWSCESIDDAKNKLVEFLAKELSSLNIDYPFDLSDFEYIWFDKQYVNTNVFYYKLFMEGQWREPWDHQDIYSDVLDKMLEHEQSNPPIFDEIYGEPDPDEEKIDNFSMENNEQVREFEKKLTEIINQSKNVHLKEDLVKECKCEKCLESNVLRESKDLSI